MNTHSFSNRRFRGPILRRSVMIGIALLALAWCDTAICGEIHDAAEKGDLAKVQALLKENPELVSSKDGDGMTPLIWAAFNGHKDVVELLIANKADVNAKNNYGLTALHYAATGHKDVAELLLAHKADVNTRDNNNWTPLWIAIDKNQAAIAVLLIESGAEVNAPTRKDGHLPDYPLEFAMWPNAHSWPGQEDVLKALLAKGAKSPWLSQVKGFDPYGFNALATNTNAKGEVMVGSIPFFLGAGMAQRPWKLPSGETRSHTGTNFFRWANPSKDNGPITTVVISDAAGHRTGLALLPPVYIGDGGIAYAENISQVRDGGPFADVVVTGSINTKRVTASRGNGTVVELTQSGTSFQATLGRVTDYEPISVTTYGSGDAKQSTVEFDCIYRGVQRGEVVYYVHP